MLYSSTVLARNASSILAHISRLPASLASHPLLFTLSTNAPAPSLSTLVSALSSFSSSSGSVGCLSAPIHPGAPGTSAAPIACSLAFFRKEHSVPFHSDIPGRPETQVGRWHAMRRTGEREESVQGGEVELTEEVEWEKVWGRRTEGDVIPPALKGLGYVSLSPVVCSSLSCLIVRLIAGKTTCTPLSLSRTTPRRVSIARSPPFRWRPRSVSLFARLSPSPEW